MNKAVSGKSYGWIKIVERQNCPLFLNLICSGMTDEYTKKILGEELGYDFYVYLNGEVYISSESSKNIEKKFNSLISKKGLVSIESFLEKWYQVSNRLLETSRGSKDYVHKSNGEVSEFFLKITGVFHSLSTALMLVVPVGKYLEEQIKGFLIDKGRKDIERELFVLTRPDKKNENELEYESIKKISELIKEGNLSLDGSDERLNELIEEHINEYGHINSGRYFRDAWSKKDILNRLSSKLKENTKETLFGGEKGLLSELKLSAKEKKIVAIAKKYAYFRTYRMNVFVKAGFLLRDLLFEIAKRLKIGFDELIYMTPGEVISCLNSELDASVVEIKQRFETYGYYVKDGYVETFSGDNYLKFKEKYFSNLSKSFGNDLKGTVAHKGVVKGIVKIVKSVSDLNKVGSGDILVSPMTIPSFVPAMEKAAGFVTDEGGILCHVAIVSREMKKPCVIGTKHATTVLKDGMLVEVDAIKGIVRILNIK
jgi:phosphohistidine swiveling domain-containing protein